VGPSEECPHPFPQGNFDDMLEAERELLLGRGYVQRFLKNISWYSVPGCIYAIYHLAARTGDVEIMQLLLRQKKIRNHPQSQMQYCYTLTAAGATGIAWACRHGHLPALSFALSIQNYISGQRPSELTRGLCWAARFGYLDIVQRLLKEPTTDPTACTNYALRWSLHNGHKQIFQALVDDKRVHTSTAMRISSTILPTGEPKDFQQQ